MEENKTQAESVICVYRDGVLIAIVKRDEKTRKKIIYTIEEAEIDDIVDLISPSKIA